jgi:hypothetical protein
VDGRWGDAAPYAPDALLERWSDVGRKRRLGQIAGLSCPVMEVGLTNE